jgi:hypothetical protein
MHLLSKAGSGRLLTLFILFVLGSLTTGCPGKQSGDDGPIHPPRDTTSKPNRCCPDSLQPGDIKVWATVYLKAKSRDTTGKIDDRVREDVRTYETAVRHYIDSVNRVDKRYFRVAFAEEYLNFSRDGLHVQIKIYIKHPKYPGFPDEGGQRAPQDTAGPRGDTARSKQAQSRDTGGVHAPKCPPDVANLTATDVEYVECPYEL